MDVPSNNAGDRKRSAGGMSMDYEEFIKEIQERLQATIETVPEHNLDAKYVASACRDYAEALRALEQAKLNNKRGV